MHLLEVKNLSTVFHTNRGIVKAVDGISFNLTQGEVLGLVGESGSGKSVSAMSLLRLIPNPPGKITGGEIHFVGQNILDFTEEEMRIRRGNEIAMIFQEPMTSLNPTLTIGHQLMEPLKLHKKMSSRQAREKAIELLEEVHIPDGHTRMKSFPHMLSGGMRQRIMIAMAVACNPKLIIADEPTTALDVTIQAQLLSLLKNLASAHGTSLIIITHNLGIIARYADRVNVMYGGRIVEKASAKSLYATPCHPYTLGLMASVPRLDHDIKKKLTPIMGSPPNMLDLPSGCSFHPRCCFKIDQCKIATPDLKPINGNHEVACWNYKGAQNESLN